MVLPLTRRVTHIHINHSGASTMAMRAVAGVKKLKPATPPARKA
jgi:Cft2 family RNA processing exonuclease